MGSEIGHRIGHAKVRPPRGRHDQHAFVANVVITPLALVGGVFYYAGTLAEPWPTLIRIDPIYHLVDATPGGLTGFHESPAWICLLVASVVRARRSRRRSRSWGAGAPQAVTTAWEERIKGRSG